MSAAADVVVVKWWRLGALSVIWQTLLLVLISLIVAQTINIALLIWLPPPRPEFNRIEDIAATLSQRPRDPEDRDSVLLTHVQSGIPAMPRGLVAEPAQTALLAARLKVPAVAVRLYFEPDRPMHGMMDFGRRRGPPGLAHRREPIFFGQLRAGLAIPGGWRVAETPEKPLIGPWQHRMMLWLAVSMVALLPLAWLFARRISRPIRRFADAADRLRADPSAPAVPEEGPAELRVTARALNRMQARLATHLAERTAMIGAIAHDLRTPLARVAFRIEAAPQSLRDKVMADVEQMRAMISATIGFVRHTGRAETRVPVDLAACLAEIVAQERELGRAVTLGPVAAACVPGDPLALSRLFQNLIDNGIAYAGAVEVALETGIAASDRQATITFADRGPGLAPALLEEMFQPFARGEPSRNRETGGIGLGLTIARTIAEEHGGTLSLANREGGGIAAVVALPLAA